MNNDYETLQRAMAEGMVLSSGSQNLTHNDTQRTQRIMRKDCSSVATFKGVCDTLSICRPMLFLLENVDSLESSDDDRESQGLANMVSHRP